MVQLFLTIILLSLFSGVDAAACSKKCSASYSGNGSLKNGISGRFNNGSSASDAKLCVRRNADQNFGYYCIKPNNNGAGACPSDFTKCDQQQGPPKCNGHGSEVSGSCVCNTGYAGFQCEATCAGGAGNPCNGHGACKTLPATNDGRECETHPTTGVKGGEYSHGYGSSTYAVSGSCNWDCVKKKCYDYMKTNNSCKTYSGSFSGLTMVSQSTPGWGCRCCLDTPTKVDDWIDHPLWTITSGGLPYCECNAGYHTSNGAGACAKCQSQPNCAVDAVATNTKPCVDIKGTGLTAYQAYPKGTKSMRVNLPAGVTNVAQVIHLKQIPYLVDGSDLPRITGKSSNQLTFGTGTAVAIPSGAMIFKRREPQDHQPCAQAKQGFYVNNRALKCTTCTKVQYTSDTCDGKGNSDNVSCKNCTAQTGSKTQDDTKDCIYSGEPVYIQGATYQPAGLSSFTHDSGSTPTSHGFKAGVKVYNAFGNEICTIASAQSFKITCDGNKTLIPIYKNEAIFLNTNTKKHLVSKNVDNVTSHFLHNGIVVGCGSCGQGYGATNTCPRNGGCAICALGSYQPTSGSKLACSTCPANSTTKAKGTVLPTDCLAAPGYFKNNAGNFEKCALAKYKTEVSNSSVKCLLCPTGKTTTQTGSTALTDCFCNAGTHHTGAVPASGCQACTAGKVQPDVGKGSCSACPSGKTSNNGLVCKNASPDPCNGNNCSGHGTCAKGVCTCDKDWKGSADCSTCTNGLSGKNCQYSRSKTCNDQGDVKVDALDVATCECVDAWKGNNSCSACGNGYFGTKCQFSNKGTCNGNGVVTVKNDKGTCKCNAVGKGEYCQFTDAITCNNRGNVDNFGTCTCTTKYTGASCQNCAATYAGLNCQYSNKETCSNKGIVANDGSCTCEIGWTGKTCNETKNTPALDPILFNQKYTIKNKDEPEPVLEPTTVEALGETTTTCVAATVVVGTVAASIAGASGGAAAGVASAPTAFMSGGGNAAAGGGGSGMAGNAVWLLIFNVQTLSLLSNVSQMHWAPTLSGFADQVRWANLRGIRPIWCWFKLESWFFIYSVLFFIPVGILFVVDGLRRKKRDWFTKRLQSVALKDGDGVEELTIQPRRSFRKVAFGISLLLIAFILMILGSTVSFKTDTGDLWLCDDEKAMLTWKEAQEAAKNESKVKQNELYSLQSRRRRLKKKDTDVSKTEDENEHTILTADKVDTTVVLSSVNYARALQEFHLEVFSANVTWAVFLCIAVAVIHIIVIGCFFDKRVPKYREIFCCEKKKPEEEEFDDAIVISSNELNLSSPIAALRKNSMIRTVSPVARAKATNKDSLLSPKNSMDLLLSPRQSNKQRGKLTRMRDHQSVGNDGQDTGTVQLKMDDTTPSLTSVTPGDVDIEMTGIRKKRSSMYELGMYISGKHRCDESFRKNEENKKVALRRVSLGERIAIYLPNSEKRLIGPDGKTLLRKSAGKIVNERITESKFPRYEVLVLLIVFQGLGEAATANLVNGKVSFFIVAAVFGFIVVYIIGFMMIATYKIYKEVYNEQGARAVWDKDEKEWKDADGDGNKGYVAKWGPLFEDMSGSRGAVFFLVIVLLPLQLFRGICIGKFKDEDDSKVQAIVLIALFAIELFCYILWRPLGSWHDNFLSGCTSVEMIVRFHHEFFFFFIMKIRPNDFFPNISSQYM